MLQKCAVAGHMAGVSIKDLAREPAQEELGWGAAWEMGVKFATGCYSVTLLGVGPCYSPRMNSQLP